MADLPPIDGESTSNAVGFSTQGQLSWTSLVTTTWSATVGILSRISAAGVDPYTLVVGQKLGAQFRFSALGRRRMVQALQNLPCFQSIGTALYFGFGVNHLVRVMGRTEEGQLCLALCASLTECYEISVAAEILVETVRLSRAPEDLQPSILQWEVLLKVSGGILSTSSFPEHAERLMALHPLIKTLGYGNLRLVTRSDVERIRGCSTPESLAKSLNAIAQVTRGELESVTIIGGADAGWVAAFAEWHFDVTVQITLGTDGSVLYKNHADAGMAQVRIVYEVHKEQGPPPMQITGRTHKIIELAGLITEKFGTLGTDVVTGRIPWAKVLHSSFGSDFDKLLENRKAVAGAIGCAARIMKAISTAEEGIHSKYLLGCRYYDSDSYGRGFIANLVDWLPELSEPNLRRDMEQECKRNLAAAFAQYDAYISALRVVCRCSVCEGIDASQDGYCLVMILEVIMRTARMLSVLDLMIPLLPCRLGFEVYYEDQYILHRQLLGNEDSIGREKRERHAELGACFFVADDDSAQSVSALRDALKLFCGRLPFMNRNDDNETAALCRNGICAYWSSLGKASGGQLGGRITIATGQIELHNKSYDSLLDTRDVLQNDLFAHVLPLCTSFADLSVIVRETTTALRIHFEIVDRTRGHETKIVIHPANTISTFLECKGLVRCQTRVGQCKEIASRAQIDSKWPGFISYKLDTIQTDVVEANIVQQWLLLRGLPRLTLLVEKECIDCCLTTAVIEDTHQSAARNVLVIRAVKD